MPLTASAETRAWLQERGMGGYLKIIDAPAHPDAQGVARRICPEAITNNVLRAALDLQRGGDHDVDIPPASKLKEYFGEYSASGKAYRTYGGPNRAFGEIARILMEYAFVHTNPTSMPQNKAAIIISAYEGHRIDWGIITGEGLRAAIASFQSGKKMLSVVTHFLTVLFPPSSLPSPRKLTSPPPPRRQREKLVAISHEAWEEPTPPSPPAADQHPASAPPPTQPQQKRAVPETCQEWEEETNPEDHTTDDVTIRQPTPRPSVTSPEPSPRPTVQQAAPPRPQKRKQAEATTPPAPEPQTQPSKKRRLNRESSADQKGAEEEQALVVGQGNLAIVPVEASLNQGKIEHGQTTQISEDEVLGYKDLPAEAYEFSALLRLGTTYELVDFLARARIAAVARMADEHAETKMIQRALLGETEPKDDRALQKIGRKKQAKQAALLMEVPELNTALIEAYRDLDRTTRAAKDMARKIKIAQQQAKVATELWHAAERKLAAWEQNRPEQQLLSLPATTTEALPAPPRITMIDESTVTDTILTIQASTLTDSVHMVDACTTTEPVTPKEKTESPPPRPTKEVATQTEPPLRDYRAELKEEQRRTERHDKQHQEAMARLKEEASQRMAEIRAQADQRIHEQNEALGRLQAQAAGREAELTSKLEEYAATMAEKEREVLELQAALDNAHDWNRRQEESHRQREERMIAENAELQSQRTTFKEMSDEFFIKCKLLSEQNEKLSDDCLALHEEKAVECERVRAECKKEWEKATEELTKHYE